MTSLTCRKNKWTQKLQYYFNQKSEQKKMSLSFRDLIVEENKPFNDEKNALYHHSFFPFFLSFFLSFFLPFFLSFCLSFNLSFYHSRWKTPMESKNYRFTMRLILLRWFKKQKYLLKSIGSFLHLFLWILPS